MKAIKLILFFFLLCSFSFAEDRQHKVDSLKLVLQHAHLDTNNILVKIELSSQLYEMDEYEEALRFAQQAKDLAISLRFQSGLALAYRRIGTIYTEQGKYPQAVESLLKAMKLYETSNNAYGIFMVNNNLGTVYYFQQDYNEALQYYFKAYSYKNNDARTCSNIGMVYVGQHKYELGKHFFNKALVYYQQESNNNGVALMLNNIGSVYEYENYYDSALTCYSKALLLKKELKDNQGICDGLASIGDIYMIRKDYTKSLRYELKSLLLAEKIGYLSNVRETEEKLSNIYLELGDTKNALEHYKRFTIAKDSMFNVDVTKRIVSSQKDFEFQKIQERAKMEQAQKDAIQAEQFKSQKFQKNVFITGFALVVLFFIVLFRGYKKIQLSNKKLEQANAIIAEQKALVEHKNKEVTDNINYAERIQRAMLPSSEYIQNNFPESFIIYRPKDIVSGDFYWAYSDGHNKYFATADCTGHGVSGAMMSMIGASLLNEIVIERNITSPDLVLNALRDEIIKSLNKQGASEERKDGMDISFCKITDMRLECACANNPIYIIRNSNVIELKANRFPVGKYVSEEKFSLNSFNLQKDDTIYTLSDGFCDQFGGDKGKKLMSKRFKEWITEIPHTNMQNVKAQLENRFTNWIGEGEQIDDVTIMTVKV